MPFTFRPAIVRGETLYELPRPLPQLKLVDTWDSEGFKVPLRDGETRQRHSRNGVVITLSGDVLSHDGTLQLDEQAMFETLEGLRAALHVGGETERYRLYLYFDAATETYRHFRDCSTLKFEYDLSDATRFRYELQIHAEDPQLYTTGLE
ncbi:hypothetical protein GC163_07820 [bacterium]|nr:hypothetical protein [bacterium]